MNKKEFQELISLSAYGELSDIDQKRLDAYLKQHPEKKKELNDLKKFRSFVTSNTSAATSDALLDGARRQFRAAVINDRPSVSVVRSILDSLSGLFEPRFALTGAGALSLGVMIGYCSFTGPAGSDMANRFASDEHSTGSSNRIENIRFIDADANDGEIEFEFEAVAPVRMKGRIDDPGIQKVLSHALVNESNAGVRLSALNTISRQIEMRSITDPSVRSALITTMTTDGNPGVRMEALRALQQCAFGNDIRDALLTVLKKDDNAGVRVAAINALGMAKLDGKAFDKTTVDALKHQMEKENNHYIRNRAASLVKEIYQ